MPSAIPKSKPNFYPRRTRGPLGRVAAFDEAWGRRPDTQKTDAVDSGSLLCACTNRPRGRAAEQRDELAAFHSITSLARASSFSGIVRPSALAVVRLMTRSNSVGCSTGMSPGLAPRSILSTRSAARRHMCGQFGP
jgi:hypothetical protein